MSKKKFKAGELIIKYGEIGQEYFTLNQGTCKITTYEAGTKPDEPNLNLKIALVKTLRTDLRATPRMPMVDFGEIALEYNDETRSSTVTALTDCDVWVLPPLSLVLEKEELGKISDLHLMN